MNQSELAHGKEILITIYKSTSGSPVLLEQWKPKQVKYSIMLPLPPCPSIQDPLVVYYFHRIN